jgi:hypothetical protein
MTWEDAPATGDGWENPPTGWRKRVSDSIQSFNRGAAMLARGAASYAPGAIAGGVVAGPPGALVGSLVVPVADAVSAAYNLGAERFGYRPVEIPSEGINRLLSKAGLPEPETTRERVMVAAGGGLGGVGTQVPAAAKLATTSGSALVRGIARSMSEAPMVQTATAPAVAGAGQFVTEKTGSPLLGIGAAFGAGAAAAGAARFAGVGPKEPVPTRAQVAERAGDQYKASKDTGVIVTGDSVRDLARVARQDLAGEGFSERMPFDKLKAALAELDDAANTGKPQSLQELEILRRRANMAAGSVDRDEARLGGKLVDAIDEFVDGIDEKTLASLDDPTEAIAALNKARDLWRRNRKAEIIETALYRAENSPADPESALRTAFRQIANDDKRMRSFSDEEKAAILDVVRGTNMQKALRKFGDYVPNSTTVMGGSALGAYLGNMFFGPEAAGVGAVAPWAAAVAGAAARSASKGATSRNAQALDEMVRLGRIPRTAMQPSIPFRGALATVQPPSDRAELNDALRRTYAKP